MTLSRNRAVLAMMAILAAASFRLHAAEGKTKKVYFIRSESFSRVVVSPSYVKLLYRRLKHAYNDPETSAIILEIDTPGGRIDSALTIKDLILKHVSEKKEPLIAYVNTHAISAGALISLACKHLVIAEGGTIGDAAPVIQKDGKLVRLGEKVVSPIRAVFKSLGEKYNRPERVLMAMVDSDIILTRARDGIDKPAGKLLTLSAKEALRLKVAEFITPDMSALLRKYGLSGSKIVYLDYSDSDRALIFMTSPIVAGILLTLGMVGLIFEVKTPGWGVGGTIGLVSLAAFFTTQALINPGTWAAPILFIVGVVLLLIEAFVIPGFGLVGVVGAALVLGSILMALGVGNLRQSASILAGSLVATAFLTALLFKLIPKTRTFNKIVLNDSGKTFISPTDHDRVTLEIGDTGKALTNLRPAGTVLVEGNRLDAVSEGDFIDQGTKVEVIQIQGMRVVVRPKKKN